MPAPARARAMRLGSAAALALGLLAGALPVRAEEPQAPESQAPPEEDLLPVNCTVSIGFATGQKGEVDERFRGLPSSFGSVQLWKEQAMKLQFGEWGHMPLPTGTELGVQPVNVRGRTLSMKFDLPGVVSTRLRLQNHSPLMVGPLPHDGGYLVIRVEPEFTDHLSTEPDAAPAPIPVNSRQDVERQPQH
jgi:hypothetical protein